MAKRVTAFPVWRIRREDGIVEVAEHPDTGRWWYRRSRLEFVNIRGLNRPVYKMGPWECPQNQPVGNPVLGMRQVRRRSIDDRWVLQRANLPIHESEQNHVHA